MILFLFLLTADYLKKPESPSSAFAYIVLFATALLTLLNIYEKIRGIRGIGYRIAKGIKNWFVAPIKISGSLAEILETVAFLKSELKTDGGGSLNDAVARIEGNQNLAQQQRKVEDDLSPTPIFTTDVNNLLTYSNPAWLKLVGCEYSEEMKGKGWLRVIPENSEFRKNPVPFSGEIEIKNLKTNESISVYCTTRPIKIEDKTIENRGTFQVVN